MVNPGLENGRFSSIERLITVDEGRLNEAGAIMISEIDRSIPFRNIASGEQQALLDSGNLELDLSDTILIFPDGRNQGPVYVALQQLSEIGHSSRPSAVPQWAYMFQPMGIEVSGSMGIDIALPQVQGSHEYVSEIGDRVLLVGYDPDVNDRLNGATHDRRNGAISEWPKRLISDRL